MSGPYVFISYKTHKEKGESEGTTPQYALDLQSGLEERGIGAFIDERGLRAGVRWADEIFKTIWRSDVLIVLLEPGTEQSEWVQREIDAARGAHVEILPLRVKDKVNIKRTLEKLALAGIQYARKFEGTDEEYNRLVEDIKSLTKYTRRQQKQWIYQLHDRWSDSPEMDRQQAASYQLRDKEGKSTQASDKCKIYLSTGNMALFQEIDVLVNTENDYMQMARRIDRNTLSAELRRFGAKDANDDSLQAALNEQFTSRNYHRPVEITEVIPTRPGHPDSELVKNGVRYIFHTATVTMMYNTLVPISPKQISEAIRNVLAMVEKVNAKKGVISPEHTDAYNDECQKQDSFEPIKSIVFPLFGTGQGGHPIEDIAKPMAWAIERYLRNNQNNPDFSLEEIYLTAYSESAVEVVKNALNSVFQPVDTEKQTTA
jgi:O-acetyl-ADP-ribose deacetylase (regulator of RNase III)